MELALALCHNTATWDLRIRDHASNLMPSPSEEPRQPRPATLRPEDLRALYDYMMRQQITYHVSPGIMCSSNEPLRVMFEPAVRTQPPPGPSPAARPPATQFTEADYKGWHTMARPRSICAAARPYLLTSGILIRYSAWDERNIAQVWTKPGVDWSCLVLQLT